MGDDAESDTGWGSSRLQELLDENQTLRLEVAKLQGRMEALQERLGAQDAADEHHRVELETALAEAADARLQLKEAQVRVEEWRRRVADANKARALAERQRDRAEQERAAIIAALGRRARRQLDKLEPSTD